jgi:hypothetical protein
VAVPELIQRPSLGATPATVQLATSADFAPLVVSAVFDGFNAGDAFLPCLSLYSPEGTLISRTFPAACLPGDQVEVTYAPALDNASDAGEIVAESTALWIQSDTNPKVVVEGPCVFVGYIFNTTGVSSSVTAAIADNGANGTGPNVVFVPGPTGLGANVKLPVRMRYGITVGVVDSITGAPYAGADLMQLTIYYSR